MEYKNLALLMLVMSLVLLPVAYSTPVPSYFSKGTYAKYDLKMTAQAKGIQMTITGETGWEVLERTSTDLILLVYGKAEFMGFNVEYKYKVYIDPNTGKVKKVEWIQSTGGQQKPLPGTEITGEGMWLPTDVKEGSKIVVGKGKTATIVGTEVVKDASGKSWVCWKAVTDEGMEIYYDKTTGLLIKIYFSKTMETGQVELLILLKETNVSAGAGGILSILGYITVGGYAIPVLLLVIAVVVIVAVIVVLVLLLRKPSQPTTAPAPPPPPPPPPS